MIRKSFVYNRDKTKNKIRIENSVFFSIYFLTPLFFASLLLFFLVFEIFVGLTIGFIISKVQLINRKIAIDYSGYFF